MTRHVVVPLDGSAFAETVLPLARSLADGPGGTIHLVYAQEPPVGSASLPGLAGDPKLQQDITARMTVYLQKQADALAPIVTKTHVKLGSVGPVVTDVAAETRADVIVISTHGRSGLDRAWIGSGTESVLLKSRAPVLVHHPPDTLRGPEVADPPTVLVAVDQSEFSLQIIPVAERFAEAIGATIDLITVVEPIVIHANVLGSPVLDTDELGTGKRELRGASFLADVAADMESRGVTVRTKVLIHERPAQAIIGEAERSKASAIAMTTHGRRAVARMLFGSVTDKVVRGSQRDVLVVRGE